MLESYWLQICPYYDSRVVFYDCKMFIRLATEVVIFAEKYCSLSLFILDYLSQIG